MTVVAGRPAFPAGGPLVSESELDTALEALSDDSPRGGNRLELERKPTLAFDQVYPNALTDHRIVWIHDTTTYYAIGRDNSLRLSTDAGKTWGRRLSNAGGSGSWAKLGLFLRTAAGTLLTTYHPYDLSAPKIQRSTDGVTWADVVAAQTNVNYLGPTSICQDPVTGYLYLTEYVTVSAATTATWKISRSTDDGATWSTFHTFQRDSTAYPTTAVRHGHGIQWDPVDEHLYFLCGDAEDAAGLYRVNAGGTDVEAVITNADVDTDSDIWAGGVGMMFFPDYIAWGVDQVSDSWLVRVPRADLDGSAVERVARLQSTGFYCIRTSSDNTEWLMSVSNEDGTGGRLDNAIHFYRVSDDGATLDEVASETTAHATAIYWGIPVGNPLGAAEDKVFWLASNVKNTVDQAVASDGWQGAARLVWGSGAGIQKPESASRSFYQPMSQSSGLVSLTTSEVQTFGVLRVPLRAKRLYIIDCGAHKVSGSGLPYFRLYNSTAGATVTDARTTDAITDQYASMKTRLTEEASPYVFVTGLLTPDQYLFLQILEGGVNSCTGTAFFTYAWGF